MGWHLLGLMDKATVRGLAQEEDKAQRWEGGGGVQKNLFSKDVQYWILVSAPSRMFFDKFGDI